MSALINKRRLIANCTSGVVENLTNVFVLVWLHQYLIKRISAAEYSLYPVVMAMFVFTPLFSIVLTSGLGRYAAEAHAKGDDRRVTQIVSTMFPLLLAVGGALMAGALVLARFLDRVLKIEPGREWEAQLMLALLVFAFCLRLVLAPFNVGPYVKQRFVLLNSLIVGNTLLRSALLFALLVGISPRVIWVVVANVAADISIMVATLVISKRLLPALRFQRAEIRWELARGLTTFGFWNTLCFLAYMIRKSADPLILNRLATPRDITAFNLGNLADNQIETTTQKAVAPLQPTMVALSATGDKSRLQEFYLRGGRYSLWAALLVAVPALVYRHELWSLYLGNRFVTYSDAATVMALLLCRYWVSCPNDLIFNVAHATNRLKPLAIRWMLAAALNIAVTLYLVGGRKWGATGSAAGTLISVLAWEPLVMWPISLRLVGLSFGRWFRETIWPGVLPSLVAGSVSLLVRSAIHPDSWLKLAGVVAIAAAVYLAVLALFCLKQDERQDLLRIREKVRGMIFSTPRVAGAA